MLSFPGGRVARRGRSMLVGVCLYWPLAVLAGDLGAGVYLQVPLGQGPAFYGLRAGWQSSASGWGEADGVEPHWLGVTPQGAVMEWRNHFDGSRELWMNGTRLSQTDVFYADAAASGSGSGIDGQVVAAVIVGAALVAAIVNADSVKGCVGTACPPLQPPPDPPGDGGDGG